MVKRNKYVIDSSILDEDDDELAETPLRNSVKASPLRNTVTDFNARQSLVKRQGLAASRSILRQDKISTNFQSF